MITCPDGWVDRGSAGGLILLPRDEQLPGCVMQYQERMIPQRSLWSLVREVLSFDAGLKVTSVGAVECFVTDEGEYAAMVRVSGVHAEQPVAHLVGAIFGEDFSTLLDARVRDVAQLETYRQLVLELMRKDRLCLGMRRRRVLFMPPPGWRAVGRGLATALYPPDYPRTLSCIVVSPAEPIGSGDLDVYQQCQRQDAQRGLLPVPEQPDEEPQTLVTPSGLSGQLWREVRAAPGGLLVARDLAVLSDDTYLYVVRLDSSPHAELAAHRAVLAGVIHSLRRIQPASHLSPAGAGTSLIDSPYKFWSD